MMVTRNRLKKEKGTGNLTSRSKGGKRMSVCILLTTEAFAAISFVLFSWLYALNIRRYQPYRMLCTRNQNLPVT